MQPTLEFAFAIKIELEQAIFLGASPNGNRRAAVYVKEGMFEGSGLRGTVRPHSGADWASVPHGLRTRIEPALKQHALTPIQATVLSIIDQHPGLSSAALARRFYVSPQNMGRCSACWSSAAC